MPFFEKDSIRYYTFDLFNAAGVRHAIFTRGGGVSRAPWASLNVGGTVGDDPASVQENRRRSFQALDRPIESLYDVWQVHGREVVATDAPRPSSTQHIRADAILTGRPEVTLFMRFADCVPVLLYDPARQVAGLVHAGWQGTVLEAAAAAVETMRERYGSNPADLLAGIGPSIGPDHYTVGQDVIERVQASFGADASGLLHTTNGARGERDLSERGNPAGAKSHFGVQFDLWSANRLILEKAGVRQVEVSGICTACHLEDWYSHRAEAGRTGRFGALIALPSKRHP